MSNRLYHLQQALNLPPVQGENQDLLFFMTARYHLAVVSYDASKGDLVTRAYGDVKVWMSMPASGYVVHVQCTCMFVLTVLKLISQLLFFFTILKYSFLVIYHECVFM